MEPTTPSGPIPLPAGARILAASVRGLTLLCPEAVPKGSVLEFDLLLGAWPLSVMGRVTSCRPSSTEARHEVEMEFVALAQIDRDSVADFLQAIGVEALRVREHREI